VSGIARHMQQEVDRSQHCSLVGLDGDGGCHGPMRASGDRRTRRDRVLLAYLEGQGSRDNSLLLEADRDCSSAAAADSSLLAGNHTADDLHYIHQTLHVVGEGVDSSGQKRMGVLSIGYCNSRPPFWMEEVFAVGMYRSEVK